MTIYQTIMSIVAFFLSLFGLWYKIDRDTNARINMMSDSFANKLAEAIKTGDEKRSRIYERLDQVKTSFKDDADAFHKEVMNQFVPLKICTLVHSNSEKIMSDFKNSTEDNFKDIKELFQNLEKKVDALTEKVFANHNE